MPEGKRRVRGGKGYEACGKWKSTPSEEQVLALAHLRSPSHMLDTILWAIFKCTESIRRKFVNIQVCIFMLCYAY